jgi:hypothetical protein
MPDGPSRRQNAWARARILLGILLGVTIGMLAGIRPAHADPHAVFFTDRAQAQLFFNVLAALNQADYVENPDTPPLQSDRRLGQFLRTGRYERELVPRRVIRDASGNPLLVVPAPEPAEQAGVELPRIRVRQVTSDDGDVFYRERLERRALAEEMRVLIAQLACRGAETIFGPPEARSAEFCPPRNDDILSLPLP